MRPLSLLLLASVVSPAFAQTPRSSVPVEATAGAFGLALDCSDKFSAVLWGELATGNLFVSTSTDEGKTWSAGVRVDADATGAFKGLETYSLQIAGSNVYVAWEDTRATGADVFYTYSTDCGATFAPEMRIDSNYASGASNPVRDWKMVVTSGTPNDNVYFVINVDNANEELYLVANDQTGGLGDFLAPVFVPQWLPQAFDIDSVDMDAEGDTVYVVWDDNSAASLDFVYFNRATDRGQTWAAGTQRLITDAVAYPMADAQEFVSIDALGSTVAILFGQEDTGVGNDATHANVSTDGGTTFNGDFLLSAVDVDRGTAVVDKVLGNVVMIYEDDRTGSDQIHAQTSTDGGLTYGAAAQLSTTGGSFPAVVQECKGTSAVIGATWTTVLPDDVEAAYSLDGGLTWITVTPIDDTIGDADFAVLCYNPAKCDFIVAWLAEDLGANNVYSGGFAVAPASVADRQAAPNPSSFLAAPVILGETWTATVDLTTTGHSSALIFLKSTPTMALLFNGDFLLVTGVQFLKSPLLAGPLATLSAPIPNDPCFIGLTAYGQAVHLGGLPFRVSNAQDVTVGAF